MTLAELENCTSLSLRQLRYVLDHGLLPVGRVKHSGRGAARTFTDFEAFGIACAATMLQAGLRQSVVRDTIALLSQYQDKTRRNVDNVPLYQAYQANQTAKLEIGDGVNVRLSGTGTLPVQKFDTYWRQITTGAQLGNDYDPLILLSVNLGLLAHRMGR